ncbi:MAG: cytochrome c family protein [Schleiferiaceae bacterium]|nr:cytochrome c family protein [Schleiferiaceae bacterium]
MRNKLIVAALIVGVISCMQHGDHHANSVSHQIKEGEKEYSGVTVSSDEHTEGIKTHEVDIEGKSFHVRERLSQITSFPCSDCHTVPVNQLQVEGQQKAHWDLKMNHAGEETMNCMTCHTEDNMDILHTGTGKEISFNDSYKLCGQCHSQQYKDWQGGAHGKQVKSWAPPRVSNTCTNCHNPHDPHFESRWPSRYNTRKGVERKETDLK